MKKNISQASNITGGIMLLLIILGALANAYGADIEIYYITTLSLFVFPVVLIFVYINNLQ